MSLLDVLSVSARSVGGSGLSQTEHRASTLMCCLCSVIVRVFWCVLRFSCVILLWSVAGAAPQARPKTTTNATSVAEVSYSRSFHLWALHGAFEMDFGLGLTMFRQLSSLSALPFPMLNQVFI